MSDDSLHDLLNRLGLAPAKADNDAAMLYRLGAYVEYLHSRIASLENDSLSGLYRREVGQELLTRHIRRRPFGAFILIDIDNLKRIHNALAFSMGDRAIRLVSESITACRRAEDLGVRWGGDELVIGLRADDRLSESVALRHAQSLIDRIRQALAERSNDNTGPIVTITAEAMIVRFSGADAAQSSECLTRAIDAAFSRIQDAKKIKAGVAIHSLLPLLPSESAADYRARLSALVSQKKWPKDIYPSFEAWVDAREAARLVLSAHAGT